MHVTTNEDYLANQLWMGMDDIPMPNLEAFDTGVRLLSEMLRAATNKKIRQMIMNW